MALQVEVEVLSTKYIKPLSPTPAILKIHKLSSLDQSLKPHYYLPVYFFYQNPLQIPMINSSSQERCRRLKTSLSQLLTLYYPFAGTFRDHSSVLCDDHGVPFTHAIANVPLSTFLTNFDLHRLPKLLPDQSETRADMAKFQVTDFSCGGFVIGMLVSHAVADGVALSIFARSWATLCREQDLSLVSMTELCPNFSAAVHFPPADQVPGKATMVPHRSPFIKQGKLRVRRLVFGPSAIAALRKRAASSIVPKPTRGEVVSAHLFKCIMSSLEERSGLRKGAMASYMVNLRHRADPPFPGASMGNYLWPTVLLRVGETGNELTHLVSELRQGVTKNDNRLIEKLRAMGPEKLFDELEKVYASARDGIEFVQITNCCNFRVYENDFGWGRPVWVCMVGPPTAERTVYINVVLLTDTRSGDGIEAIVFLDEHDIKFLERNQELLAYAEFDQNPMLTGLSPPFSQFGDKNRPFSNL